MRGLMMTECPVCKSKVNDFKQKEYQIYCECPRCGPYSLSYEAKQDLPWRLEAGINSSARLSHAIYYITKREKWALVTAEMLQNILDNTELPRPQEQLENLILWLGEAQPKLGGTIHADESAIAAVGAVDISSLGFLVSHAIEVGLMKGDVTNLLDGRSEILWLQLTLNGWQLFEDLQRGKSGSRIAFMAMPFGEDELDRIYKNNFKVAVAATGFDLKRVDEAQPAGLIDDRIRVEIRQSRFLIADLTHQNRGAYWEAGFAEGLGKPVIYTCRKDVFEDKAKGTHFDTNHHLTVVWEPGNLDDAVDRLKATIRATLPEDAQLND
jgi:hypothetical protein